MTKYYARVSVLAAALIAGGIATVATSAGPKPACKGPTIFEATVLNLQSGLEVPKGEGRLCRQIAKDGNVTVGAKLKIETGSEAPTLWQIFLGNNTTPLFNIGTATTGPGQTTIDFEDTVCVGCFFNISFRLPFLSAVSTNGNDSRMFMTGFRLP